MTNIFAKACAVAALALGQMPADAVTYTYAGTSDVWDLSFSFTLSAPPGTDMDVVTPCTDNHGDTSCTLQLYLAGTPDYISGGYGIDKDDLHDIVGVHSTGGPSGATAAGCCISFNLILQAGALGQDGVYQSDIGRGPVTVSGAPAAVPEPATWGLFIGGFGLIGGAMRTHRRDRIPMRLA